MVLVRLDVFDCVRFGFGGWDYGGFGFWVWGFPSG